jgi:hypothetical protein
MGRVLPLTRCQRTTALSLQLSFAPTWWRAAHGRDCEFAAEPDSSPSGVIAWLANGSCQRAWGTDGPGQEQTSLTGRCRATGSVPTAAHI